MNQKVSSYAGFVEKGYSLLEQHVNSVEKSHFEFVSLWRKESISVKEDLPEFCGKNKHQLFKTECENFVRQGFKHTSTIPSELLTGLDSQIGDLHCRVIQKQGNAENLHRLSSVQLYKGT